MFFPRGFDPSLNLFRGSFGADFFEFVAKCLLSYENLAFVKAMLQGIDVPLNRNEAFFGDGVDVVVAKHGRAHDISTFCASVGGFGDRLLNILPHYILRKRSDRGLQLLNQIPIVRFDCVFPWAIHRTFKRVLPENHLRVADKVAVDVHRRGEIDFPRIGEVVANNSFEGVFEGGPLRSRLRTLHAPFLPDNGEPAIARNPIDWNFR